MRPNRTIRCADFPCRDVDRKAYSIPGVAIDASSVSLILISEAAAPNPADNYYARGRPLFQQTTVQAFQDAGADVESIRDILDLGVYLTTAVKCGKKSYGIKPTTIDECSRLLERELALFPVTRVLLLMGDVAIRSLNSIARRTGGPRVNPSGSTYKIRDGEFYFQGIRAFPSYLQAGPSFFIEKSKRRMIAEDIRRALDVALA
ncbi:MAG TPA: uracil-DNA glycosylase family protein [Anaerolineales bacterium]|nr:uracil-DNA glycosylase family protein [Anaerolineales bacterium]